MTGSTVLSTERAPLLKRLLRLGFWFFLLKGVLWLALPLVLHRALVG